MIENWRHSNPKRHPDSPLHNSHRDHKDRQGLDTTSDPDSLFEGSDPALYDLNVSDLIVSDLIVGDPDVCGPVVGGVFLMSFRGHTGCSVDCLETE